MGKRYKYKLASSIQTNVNPRSMHTVDEHALSGYRMVRSFVTRMLCNTAVILIDIYYIRFQADFIPRPL